MRPINHPLHIVLSILTGGLWLIPYAVILATNGRGAPQTTITPTFTADPANYAAYQAWCTQRAAEIRAREQGDTQTGEPASDT